jgi:serine/threonine protein phosphatase PrpC
VRRCREPGGRSRCAPRRCFAWRPQDAPAADDSCAPAAASPTSAPAPTTPPVARPSSSTLGFSHALLTRAGQEPGFRKTNQDVAFMAAAWAPAGGGTLLGVLDGHGPNGHHVSAHLKERFPAALAEQGAAMRSGDAAGALRAAFASVDGSLRRASGLDIDFSGSTAVVGLLDMARQCVTVGWTGDSRAVVGRRGPAPGAPAASPASTAAFHAVALTQDHKPDTPAEAARIAAAGGRVEQLVDERGQRVGPHRVWLRSAWTPGLAMSRALGDGVAHTAGVSSLPDITEHALQPDDALLILATDGIWEFISNDEAVEMAAAAPTPSAAASQLAAAAHARWVKEEDGVCDDITLIVLFLGAGPHGAAA